MEEYILPFSPVNEPSVSKIFSKTCLICFRTNNPKNKKDLFEPLPSFEQWLANSEQTTLLEKLQAFLHEKVWANECTVLCEDCIQDLNKAYSFKKRLLKSQEIWKTTFSPTLTRHLSSQEHKLNDSIGDQLSDEEINDKTSICSYEIDISADNLKAEEITEDSLSYYSCKNCDVVFANSTEFSVHKCDLTSQDTLPVRDSSDEELVLKINQQTKNNTKRKHKLAFECDLCDKTFNDIRGKNRQGKSTFSSKNISMYILQEVF